MTKTFYSNGKLLLSGEYVVLDGAKALAIPTKYGQSLLVEPNKGSKIIWKSTDENNTIWFEDSFSVEDISNGSSNSPSDISKRLIQILNAAMQLNTSFLKDEKGYSVVSKLDFPRNWGLGSSSTLLNNIAQWAKIDPFKLSNETFGGSGYDIACASNDTPIFYSLKQNIPNIEIANFNPCFKDRLHFVHLNQKQDSREAIKTYLKNKKQVSKAILEIDVITNKLNSSSTIVEFEHLIAKHEVLIGQITNQTPIQTRLFSDYENAIKSLGGWGGDFILATGKLNEVKHYFNSKGYLTIIPFTDMVLIPNM